MIGSVRRPAPRWEKGNDTDTLFLQLGETYGEDFHGDDTWCVDRIDDTDVQYLRATPERQAASDLLTACELALNYLEHQQFEGEGDTWYKEQLRAAIAKARGGEGK